MSKITLDSVASGYDLSKINNNFQRIQAALDNLLSRDGTTPNSMSADLDMNGNRIINELASTGKGFIWEGAWLTSTAYALNNLVSENGSVYICTTAHTSGTFATDLSAGKWELFASKGTSGAGSGDLVAANNLSDVADIATARTNLGAQAADVELSALASLTSAANKVPMFSGSGTATLLDFKDEDTMVSDSATAIPSQQSVKAYVNVSAGKVMQVVEATPIVTVVTCAVAAIFDNSIPQNTEGTEVITVSITPTNASNRLRIEFFGWGTPAAQTNIITALYQDTTANALAASASYALDSLSVSLTHEVAAGTTSATTFKIRVAGAGQQFHINGASGGSQIFNGVSSCHLRVTEIKV